MTVLRAATLIDGTGAAPVRDVSLVFRDGRIEAITPGAASGSPREDEIDASGMTVLPGLIDCHDHLAFHGDELAARWGLDERSSTRHLRTAHAIERTLAMGCPSGHECVVPHDPALPPSVANGVDEVRRVVRIMVRAGADVIKCATTGGASSRAGHGPKDPALKIAAGTDAGGHGHPPNAAELEHLVAAGMSPMQAIQTATGWAAECLGLAHELGTLEKGKRADAVVVEGDPLADIRILQDPLRIRYVIKDGRVEVSR